MKETPDIKIFKSWRGMDSWNPFVAELNQRGIPVFTEWFDTDIAVVLSGKYENTVLIKPKIKKILIYHELEWQDAWSLYRPVLSEYYDEMIDITNLPMERIHRVIARIRREAKKLRSSD